MISRRRFVALGASLVALRSVPVPAQESTPDDGTPRGGLGLNGAEWIELWGDPDGESDSVLFDAVYQEGPVEVRLPFLNDEDWITSFDVAPAVPTAPNLMLPLIEQYIPADAEYLGSYDAPSGSGPIRLYNSASLAEKFADIEPWTTAGWFPGGNPGDFIIILQGPEGPVENAIVAMGNNP